MKLSKVIALICLSIGISTSQISFGTEVGNYWIVDNNLASQGKDMPVIYELTDSSGTTLGALVPGLNGWDPPYIYSSFPSTGCQSQTDNVLRVLTPISKKTICEFVTSNDAHFFYFGPRVCVDPKVHVKSQMEGIDCWAVPLDLSTGRWGDTISILVKMNCKHDRQNCVSDP
jgi:hypothetical protein